VSRLLLLTGKLCSTCGGQNLFVVVQPINIYVFIVLDLNDPAPQCPVLQFQRSRSEYSYSALSGRPTQSAQTWITQLYLQITPCLPLFVSVHQMAPPLIKVADIRLQLLLIYRPRRDEKLGWPGRLTYSGWFIHTSGHPSATRRAQDRKFAGRRPTPCTAVTPNRQTCLSALRFLLFRLLCLVFFAVICRRSE